MSGLFSLESWSTVWTHRESFLLGLGNTLQTAVGTVDAMEAIQRSACPASFLQMA